MHVVIAWWDAQRPAAPGTARRGSSGEDGTRPKVRVPLTGEFPGLRDGRWIDDPTEDRQGLALIWDCADSAELSLPAISEKTFGCAPSHRWAFDLDGTPSGPADTRTPPAELELLLRA
ncbi:hypothetical protein ACIF8T_25545 [Streptomyces sp. NPDC085946]|uniref:hypothetical protein n=1 Tax=Streptomyces sp. NPDC085946 TaxID=3365744 RepID=UPI0037CF940F